MHTFLKSLGMQNITFKKINCDFDVPVEQYGCDKWCHWSLLGHPWMIQHLLCRVPGMWVTHQQMANQIFGVL